MIKNIKDIQEIFSRVNVPVLGIGVSAFNRIGPGFFIPGYRIVCLYDSKDTKLIERDMSVLSVEKVLGKSILKERKNSTTVLEQETVRDFLNSLDSPALMIYKAGKKLQGICRRNGWSIIGQPAAELEDKIAFRGIMESCGINPIPGRTGRLSEMDYDTLSKELGPKLVIQLPDKSGGKGTFFISSRKEMVKLQTKDPVLVTRFIKGPSPSITGCVTAHGVVCTGPQYQLLDIPECMNPGVGSGVFCGHDWTASQDIPEGIRRKAIEHATRIGEYLKKQGYRGMFGLDMVWEQESDELYIVELNPRLLGSIPVLTMVQLAAGEIPIMALHIMEFLDLDYELSLDEVNRSMQGDKMGSHLILYNKNTCPAKNLGELEAGIYTLSRGRLVFKRPSYDLRDLKDDEFLMTEGVHSKNRVFKPHGRIMRFITLHSIMDKKTLKLNAWASERVKAVYAALRI